MADFHLLITDWYRLNKRNLPWRKTNDPYLIWLSEIILQQTRIDQGLNYYNRFAQNYPTINDLARASEQDVLKDWQGLGYYSRARNLHFTAKEINTEFAGKFPDSYKDILALKGVGEYTAAAISSFAFGLPHAVVDGNVFRVLSRYFDVDLPIDSSAGKKYFFALANELINKKDPGLHNQAMMELGSLICKPQQALCNSCPLSSTCLALKNDTVYLRPVKSKTLKIKDRYFSYLIFKKNETVLVEKREDKDIWLHLYQFPLIESHQDTGEIEIKSLTGIEPVFVSGEIIHVLTHQKVHARFYHFDSIPEQFLEGREEVHVDKFSDLPLPRLIDRYIENTGL